MCTYLAGRTSPALNVSPPLCANPCSFSLASLAAFASLAQGPALVRMFYCHIRFLDRYSAKAEEYLRVEFVDGRVEHLPGPVSLYKNPVYHSRVEIQEVVKLRSKAEFAVVYTKVAGAIADVSAPATADDEDASKGIEMKPSAKPLYHSVRSGLPSSEPTSEPSFSSSTSLVRRIVQGPTAFMPSVSEEVHAFSSPSKSASKPANVLNANQTFERVEVSQSTAF